MTAAGSAALSNPPAATTFEPFEGWIPAAAINARCWRSTGQAVAVVSPGTSFSAWESSSACWAGLRRDSAAVPTAWAYIWVAAASRAAGSAAARAALVAETWAASRPRARVKTSTAVSGWVAFGDSTRCGSCSAVEK